MAMINKYFYIALKVLISTQCPQFYLYKPQYLHLDVYTLRLLMYQGMLRIYMEQDNIPIPHLLPNSAKEN